MELPLMMIVAVNQVRRQYEECAPNAPALPYVERAPRNHRMRGAVSGGLIRLAHAIAPPEPVCR
jgi:hypothetical protein